MSEQATPQIAVLGAGVIGLTTAYYLAKEGYDVHVFETANAPATGASSANGYQLSYSYLMPPFTFWDIASRTLKMLMGTDPQTTVAHLKRRELLRRPGWFMAALWQTLPFNYRRNYQKVLHMGQLSQFLMETFISSDGKDIDFDFSTQGKLTVLKDRKKLYEAWANAQYVSARTGWETKKLNPKECEQLAPFLADSLVKFVGGIYSKNNHAGNCHAYCIQLAELLERDFGVSFTYNAPEKPIADYEAEFDAVVVACGYKARRLLKTIGVRVPLYPVKGYSYDFAKVAPQFAYVTHKQAGMVVSDMGSTTRLSGFADFVGVSDADDATRQQALLNKMQELFPHQSLEVLHAHTGYRPLTPNGLPIIKRVKKKVFINVGQGMFGWTLAHASGQKLCDLIKKHVAL